MQQFILLMSAVVSSTAIGVAPKVEFDGPSFDCQVYPHSNNREKRDVGSFNDPAYAGQWYLNNSMNILKSWNNGFTGKGIVISVMDTGLEKNHDEFKNRYDSQASYDFVKNNTDPKPDIFLRSSHGNKVAGLAAAEANNGKCGVGVAYEAKIGGLKFIGEDPGNPGGGKDYRQGDALIYNMNYIDIYALAWGPDDTIGSKVGYNKSPESFKKGAEKGRNCKGSIYVHAAGNEGAFNDTCTYDGYVNSIYTISVTAINPDNTKSSISERCPGIIAGTHTRDGAQGVETKAFPMATADENNNCSITMSASSAAVGVASGIFALVLQANANLTWRDMQHLIARTSISDNLVDPERQWHTNGGGFKVHDSFGFGLLNSWSLIERAKTWKTVPDQLVCEYARFERRQLQQNVTLIDTVTFSKDFGSCSIQYLEHVQLVIDLTFPRNKLEIELESPNTTRSYLIQGIRRLDFGNDFVNFTTKSVHYWGENPIGDWKLKFRNVKPTETASGELRYYKLIFYGTASNPETSTKTSPFVCDAEPTPSNSNTRTQLKSLWVVLVTILFAALYTTN